MDKIREKLQGKKTYILLVLGFGAIWIDYFFGLGVSPLCEENIAGECLVSLKDTITATYGLLVGITTKAGIDRLGK
jgi:hypothetical protein